ncbi:MAG: hypothetical protein HOM04_04370 [Euryarchaeota archaeon]|nr:hypothetical protein [Euryarchaeota archaeon]
MSPRFGVPVLIALLLASSWAFTNNDTVEQWVSENTIVVQEQEVPLLQLQEQERWLVLVIDFESSPATEYSGPTQAELLLNDVAREYLLQLSGSNTQVHIDVSPRVTRASGSLSDYGSDFNGNRDMDANGKFLPMKLAEEAVLDHINYADWDEYDLNGDGMVDRLLILHTSKGQEESPGQTSNIWSHFTRFDSSIEVENGVDVGHYTMASIRTGSSGMGTILHEMMHQMGAMDLYPVHEAGHLNDWQGIGDWDIMASGNWNGGGVWPALPTSASLELLGANRTQTMDLTWPSSAQAPCIGPTILMKGMSENGSSLKVPLTEEESVWIEYRSNFGFDQHLPGYGILVTYQDRSVGDEEQNELNRDPDQPWLTVIEADGRTDLRNGVNSGEASDVFQNGSSFGAEGVLIHDHDGFLVPWVATVEINITVEIRFTAPNCSSGLSIDAPDFGGVLLPDESFPLSVSVEQTCMFTYNLTVSDGRTFIEQETQLTQGITNIQLQFSSTGTANAEAVIEGEMSCGDDIMHIKTKTLTLGRIPIEATDSGTLQAFSPSTLVIPIESLGSSEQSFTVELDGPMSRIGEVDNRIDISGNDSIEIQIEPNGLLQDRMSVNGEIVLISQSGHRWTIHLEYSAIDGERSTFDEWRTPGRLLGCAGLISAIWVLFAMMDTRPNSRPKQSQSNIETEPFDATLEQNETDAWGREIDL